MFDLLPSEVLLEIMSYLATRVPDLASVAAAGRRLRCLVAPLLCAAAPGTRDRPQRSIWGEGKYDSPAATVAVWERLQGE